MFRLSKLACAYIVEHSIRCLLQLVFDIYGIDHVQCLKESEHRRLAKPLTPPRFRRSLDAIYQVQLDLLETHTF